MGAKFSADQRKQRHRQQNRLVESAIQELTHDAPTPNTVTSMIHGIAVGQMNRGSNPLTKADLVAIVVRLSGCDPLQVANLTCDDLRLQIRLLLYAPRLAAANQHPALTAPEIPPLVSGNPPPYIESKPHPSAPPPETS